MLCCAGLIGGIVVGRYLGGPWTLPDIVDKLVDCFDE
jgi:hypothetical protein